MSQAHDFDDDAPVAAHLRGPGSNGARPFLFAVAAVALAAAAFAAVSTADFVQHLDRQVHSIHCSFVPGGGQEMGESGCRATLMSPYSSLMRREFWGGLPISLLALATFAYLVFRSLDFALRERVSRRETGYLLLAWLLPVGMSIIYGTISARYVGALCKVCAGMYVTSGLGFLVAAVAHFKAAPRAPSEGVAGSWARWFVEGVGYVAVMVGLYTVFAPVSSATAEGCGRLVTKDDPNGVLIPIAPRTGATPSIAVLDPLCPSCKAFDRRLAASGLEERLDLSAVLFPLDATCNWMVKESLHPGACAVSEAMLCARDDAKAILAWAFENQPTLLTEAKADEVAFRRKLESTFPKVQGCLGSAQIKNKVNKSLRWAVANALPVLTPQLFIGDRRVCDEDTDLGLEYTISRMLAAPQGSAPAKAN
jgi:uncharacterized membrane protein